MDVKHFQKSPTGRLVKAPGGYWAFVPHPLPPQINWSVDLVSALSDADRALGELAGVGRTLPNPHLLITLLLCQWELLPQPLLYLSAYFEKYRKAYYDGLLRVSEEGRWARWIEFFLRGVAMQARDAVLRSQRLQDLQQHYRQQFQAARSSALLLQLTDQLFATPIMTVRQVEQHLGVSFRTAQLHVNKLVKAGILREVTGRARDRVYVANEIIRTIEEPLEITE